MVKKTKYIDMMVIVAQQACDQLGAHGAGDTCELIEALINDFSITPVFKCHGDGIVSVTLTSESPDFEEVFTGSTEEVVDCMYDWVNGAFEHRAMRKRLVHVKDGLNRHSTCQPASGGMH